MRILFTSTHETSFLREDLTILRRKFDVDPLISNGWMFVFRLLRRIIPADVTFTWFASVYSFFVVFSARLLGKPSVIVVGGVDAARCPEMNYGIWLSPWKSVLVRHAVLHATRILTVDPFFEGQLRSLAGYDGSNITTLPTGYDSTVWRRGEGRKERSVLTIAGCEIEPRMNMKGIPFLLRAARTMPDVPFTIIGPSAAIAEKIRAEAPDNVSVVEFLPREKLLPFYQNAAVYCQPSYFDGLPNSICEAMLCECIPVGTSVGGIPTAIGQTGFLVPYGDVAGLVAALRKALSSPAELGVKAREHIAANFTLVRREEGIMSVLSDVTG